MLAIILFVIILGVLIVVHEFGHFIAARMCGIRVDEFGIGYPPRALKLFKAWGTLFSLNWIPFGGFVKIFGENPLDPELANTPATQAATVSDKAPGVSFLSKPRHQQAFVLFAGVLFNFLFAWLLIALGFMVGLPTSSEAGLGPVENPRLIVTNVMPGSPAAEAGLKAGDAIVSLAAGSARLSDAAVTPDGVSQFVATHAAHEVLVEYMRGTDSRVVPVLPKSGVIADRPAIGIGMDTVGTLRLPVHKAIWHSLTTTLNLTYATVVGLGHFIGDAFRGQSDLSQVTGPVGIVGLVGDASTLGFIYVLSFTAFISINLAVINLVPIPALDGGRLLFVIIEAIKRSPINAKFVYWTNAISFGLLIVLMVVVTISDVVKLW